MKKLVSISLLSMLLISASCGKTKSNDSEAVAKKKTELADLKKEQDNLTIQIAQLEKEIANILTMKGRETEADEIRRRIKTLEETVNGE